MFPHAADGDRGDGDALLLQRAQGGVFQGPVDEVGEEDAGFAGGGVGVFFVLVEGLHVQHFGFREVVGFGIHGACCEGGEVGWFLGRGDLGYGFLEVFSDTGFRIRD